MNRWLGGLAVLGLLSGSAVAQELKPIVAEGDVNAPIDAVWSAWATTAGLQQWLAPHVEIDMRVGGLMRTNYRANGTLGDGNTIENRVLAFEPGRMLSIQVATAPANFPFPNAIYKMWTVMYFEPAPSNRTHVRVVGLGFSADEESQKMRTFFERGNADTIDELRRHFDQAPR